MDSLWIILIFILLIAGFVIHLISKEKNKFANFIAKLFITFAFILGTVYLIFTNTNELYEKIKEDKKLYIEDFTAEGMIVAYGEEGLSVTPKSAYIENGTYHISFTLKNNTGKTVKVKDFGIIQAEYTPTPYSMDFEGEVSIKNKDSKDMEVTFSAYNVMKTDTDYPNEIDILLGSYVSDRFTEYDLKFYVEWRK